MGLFLLGAIVAATARNIDVMLIARFVQGLGAAASIVLSRAIVRDVASGKEAARLMSLMTMIFTIAPVIAPSIGALLVGLAGWRAPFIAIALVGSVMLAAIRLNIVETHRPGPNVHPVRQLRASFAEFFSHRQSIYGLLLLIVPPAGFMSIIAVSAALVVEIYGFSVTAYGIIFAGLGTSILIGSFVNRWLVARFDAMQLIGIGASLMGFSSLQLLTMAAFDTAPFIWLWSCACLFMFALALLLPNATVIALDPMPRIAGVASSILGTTQNLAGAGGAILGALIYEGTIRNSIVIMGASGTLTMLIFFSRSLIAPGPLVHNPDEQARE
jgi:DHA1 family bicyclomycin/chloramphenicol resistance-like MFS transporter